MESVLYKKQAKGLGHGMHIWRKRYFVYDLKLDAVVYYDEPLTSTTTANPVRGIVPAVAILQVRWLQTKKAGKRFDLTYDKHVAMMSVGNSAAKEEEEEEDDGKMENKRVMALMAQNRNTAKNWVQFLTNLLNSKHVIEDQAKNASRNSMMGRAPHKKELHSETFNFKMRVSALEETPVNPILLNSGSDSVAAPHPIPVNGTAAASGAKLKELPPQGYRIPKVLVPVLNPNKVETDESKFGNLEEIRGEFMKNLTSSRRHRWFCPQVLHATHKASKCSKNVPKSLTASQSFGLMKSVKKSLLMNKKLISDDDPLTDLNNSAPDDHMKEPSLSRSASQCVSHSDTPTNEADEGDEPSIEDDIQFFSNDRARAFSTNAFGSASHFEHLLKFDDIRRKNSSKPNLDEQRIREIDELMRSADGSFPVRKFVYHYRLFKSVFSGYDFISWAIDNNIGNSIQESKDIGDQLLEAKLIRVLDSVEEEKMENSWKMYRISTPFEREMIAKESDALQYLGFWVYLMRDPKKGMKLRTIKAGLRSRHKRFTGAEAKKWLIHNKAVSSEDEAFEFLKILLRRNILWNVKGEEFGIENADTATLQFNRDLLKFDEETSIRKSTLSSGFRAFFSSIGTDKELLELLLTEHVKQQSTENALLNISNLAQEQKKQEDEFTATVTQAVRRQSITAGTRSPVNATDDSLIGSPRNRSGTASRKKSLFGNASTGPLPFPPTFSRINSDANNDDNEIKEADLEDSENEESATALTSGTGNFNGIFGSSMKGNVLRRRSTSKSANTGVPISSLPDSKNAPHSPNETKSLKVEDEKSSEPESRSQSRGNFSSASNSGRKYKIEDPKSSIVALYNNLVVHSFDFSDKLKETFRSDDSEAHALSLDMFWELLKFQSLKSHVCSDSLNCGECREVDTILCRWVEKYCSGDKFSEPLRESLIALLMDTTWSPVKAIPFNQRIKRPGIWPAFFVAMQGAPLSIRQEALKDVSALLVNRPDNAMDLIRCENWQNLIIPFTFPEFDDLQRSNAMSINLLTLVHFHSFNVSREFVELLCSTMHLLRQYEMNKLSNSESSAAEDKVLRGKKPLLRCESIGIVRNILEHLCGKIEDKATSFGSPNAESVSWNNLIYLCHLISLFIFNTSKWNHLMQKDEKGSSIDWNELFQDSLQNSLSKYRLHRVPNSLGFTWAIDLSLAQKLLKLLTALRLGKLDQDSESPEPLTSKQKDIIADCKKWYSFFKDTVSFLQVIKEFEQIFAWDKDQMYSLCKEFITKDASKRSEWVSKLCMKQPKH